MASEDFKSKLSEELLEKAQKELGEKPEWLQRDIQALRDMVIANKGLFCPHENDGFLLMFLRARKFDYEKAVALIHKYYESRINHPDIFVKYNPASYMELYQAGMYIRLPRDTPTSPQMMVIRPGLVTDMPIENAIKGNMVQLEHLIRLEENQVNGFIFILDMSSLGWAQAKQISPSIAKKLSGVMWNSMPARIKGIHYVNVPHFFEYVFAIVRPFLTEKLQKRIKISATPDYLVEEFSRSIIPDFLGGEAKPEDLIEPYVEELKAQQDSFKAREKYGLKSVDTVGGSSQSSKSGDAASGITGTFKKLNCD